MSKVLMIGAGGVAGVIAHKCCQNSEVFSDLMIASRTLSKCDGLRTRLLNNIALNGASGTRISTAQVDADDKKQLVDLIENYKPDIIINAALPYQDLTIMDACLETGVDYVDTAN